MTLKEKLLDMDLCIDNEYLDKYVELIESNRDTKREKFKTHKHHIIPKYYYRVNNLKIDNTSNNTVNLGIKEHILCHYFLINCGKNDRFILSNIHAFNFLTKQQGHRLSLDDLNDILNKSEELEKLRLDVTSKISKERNSGGRYVNKDNIVKHISHKDVDKYLKDGWKLGNPQAVTLGVKGKIAINRDNKLKYVKKDDIPKYESEGWTIGGLKKSQEFKLKMKNFLKGHKSNNGGKVVMTNGKRNIIVSKDCVEVYLEKGWKLGSKPRSQEFKNRMSKLKKGVKNPKLSKWQKESHLIHVNNGIENKMIPENDLNEYLEKGFKRGRLYARKIQ